MRFSAFIKLTWLQLSRVSQRSYWFSNDGGPKASGETLVNWRCCDTYLAQGERFGAKTIPKTISRVDLHRSPYILQDSDGNSWSTKSLIIATGASAKKLGIEGESTFMNRGVSSCATCDGALPRFRGKPLVVVGGGDTAMEEGLFLARFASRIHVVHRRDTLRASKIMAKRAMNHSHIVFEWNSIVEEIIGNEEQGVTGVRLVDTVTNSTRLLDCSGVFVAIGHHPNTDLFKSWLQLDAQGYIISEPEGTHVKGLHSQRLAGVFACGDVKDKVYRQAITAAGSGCMAALDCIRWLEE